jgi:hypothetical protein
MKSIASCSYLDYEWYYRQLMTKCYWWYGYTKCITDPQALVARTYHPPFFNFLFTNLFSIKFLYFFIISSLFPYFNSFVSKEADLKITNEKYSFLQLFGLWVILQTANDQVLLVIWIYKMHTYMHIINLNLLTLFNLIIIILTKNNA